MVTFGIRGIKRKINKYSFYDLYVNFFYLHLIKYLPVLFINEHPYSCDLDRNNFVYNFYLHVLDLFRRFVYKF